MTNKELALNILNGNKENIIPFFPDISDWYKVKRLPKEQVEQIPTGSFISDDLSFHQNDFGMPDEFKDWTYLDFYRNINWGLPVHIYDWCDFSYNNCVQSTERKNDKIIQTFKTPLGDIKRVDQMAVDGSLTPIEYFIQEIHDWNILEFVIKNTIPKPKYDYISKILNGVGDLGIADLVIWRSPFGKILHEYAGLETTVFHLMDHPEIIENIIQIQTEIDLQVIKLAAKSPGEIIIISDHADQQILNPSWYEKYCLPFYHQAIEVLHVNGKIVSTHLDGNFKGLFHLIKKSGFDLLDGCTPAPMTNYEIEELPEAMTESMKAYLGVPSSFFVDKTSAETIILFAERIVKTLKGKVILNLGDILPANGDIYKVIELGKWISKINKECA